MRSNHFVCQTVNLSTRVVYKSDVARVYLFDLRTVNSDHYESAFYDRYLWCELITRVCPQGPPRSPITQNDPHYFRYEPGGKN
jgi:hypothetical protein